MNEAKQLPAGDRSVSTAAMPGFVIQANGRGPFRAHVPVTVTIYCHRGDMEKLAAIMNHCFAPTHFTVNIIDAPTYIRGDVNRHGELDQESDQPSAQGVLHADDEEDMHAETQGAGEAVQERGSPQGEEASVQLASLHERVNEALVRLRTSGEGDREALVAYVKAKRELNLAEGRFGEFGEGTIQEAYTQALQASIEQDRKARQPIGIDYWIKKPEKANPFAEKGTPLT